MTQLSTPVQLKALPPSEQVELLRELRTKSSRNPQATCVLAANVLFGKGSSALGGDERYTVQEQYIVASLELGNMEQAATTLRALQQKFGSSSVRVRRLHGLQAEAAGDVTRAREIYRSILKDQPSDAFSVKRMATILKAAGLISEAIDVLESQSVYLDEEKQPQKFLAVHNNDEATYRELMNLCYLLKKFDKCIFYAEECILLNPYAYISHVRHAEMCFLNRDLERSATAYAHALTLNNGKNNARAAFGLLTVSKELIKQRSSKHQQSGELDDAKALLSWTTSRLKALYQESPLLPIISMVVQQRD